MLTRSAKCANASANSRRDSRCLTDRQRQLDLIVSSKSVGELAKLKVSFSGKLSAFRRWLPGPAKPLSGSAKLLLNLAKRLCGLPKTLSPSPKCLLCITKSYLRLAKTYLWVSISISEFPKPLTRSAKNLFFKPTPKLGAQADNAKEQRSKARMTEAKPGCSTACEHQTVPAKTSGKHPPLLLRLGLLRLCVEFLLHGFG